MTDKQVNIQITAEDRASQVVQGVVNKLDGAVKQIGAIGKKLEVAGRVMQRVGRVLSVQLSAPLIAFGKSAIDTFVKFDSAVRGVRKVMEMTAKEMEADLIPAASKLAIEWGKSRIEILSTMEEFGAMGFEVKEIINATTHAVKLSQLGNLDLAQSQGLVTSLMQTFNLRGEDLLQTLATLNVVEDESAARFDDIAFGIGRFGAAMKTANVPIEAQAALLGVLQKNQDLVSINSRALKTITTRIIAPTTAAAEALAQYNIETSTSAGNLIPLNEVLEGMAGKWGDMTEAQQANFATVVAGRNFVNQFMVVMNDLSSEQSEYKRILEETKDPQEAMNRLMGALDIAAGSAEVQMGRMTAKWEELQIFVAEQLIPILVELWGKYIDPLITKFGELSEEQKKQRIEWGLILAALGPVLIFLGMAAQGVGVLFMFVGKLVVVLKFAHNALWLFAAGLNLSIGVIFLWVAVIAAAIAIGYLIIKNWDKIRDKGQELIEKVRLWWKTWKEKFEAMDNIVGRIGLAFMDHIENKYIKPIMAVIRWVDNAITKLREFFGMEGGKSGELNYTPDLNYTPMQHGGIVPGDVGKPVPILAHGGERILPRGSNIDAPFGGGGGGVTINMTGPIVMDSEERTAQLADKILRILGRQNELSRFGVGF